MIDRFDPRSVWPSVAIGTAGSCRSPKRARTRMGQSRADNGTIKRSKLWQASAGFLCLFRVFGVRTVRKAHSDKWLWSR